MADYTSDFLRALAWRGTIHQITDAAALDARAAGGRIAGYIGFDCTAPSLHVGNLVGIMLLRRLQQAGHRPIVLVGGGTTKIGDPSGKDETRPVMTPERLAENKAGIKQCFARFLTFGDGPSDAIMLDNDDWLSGLNLVDFLRDVGPHFSVNRMLAMDSVRLRLEREQSLSFLEFNYMVFQAYDFVELSRREGCCLQMGGSDQWGNIVNGVELGRRMAGAELFGLTAPLLTTASGAKMGKTAAGAVWLRPEMRSAYDYWQFWRNAEDADVGRFLRIFTDLPRDEIVRLETLGGAEINAAKAVLATEATTLAHGAEAASLAAAQAQAVYAEGAEADIPLVEVDGELPMGLLNLCVLAGLTTTNSEARRHIKSGVLSINGVNVADEKRQVTVEDFQDGVLRLAIGRKQVVYASVRSMIVSRMSANPTVTRAN